MAEKIKYETKEFRFTATEIDDKAGIFRGYASVWGAIDSYGDAVQKGAFKKTLKEKKKYPMLWSHKYDEPIGIISGREDDMGLWVEGEINQDVQRGSEIRSLMKQEAITGLSIGFQTVVEEIDKTTGVRKLKEIRLFEISPCVFPALIEAQIQEVKIDKSSGAGGLEIDPNSCKDQSDEKPDEADPGPGNPTPQSGPDAIHLYCVREKTRLLKNQILWKD